MNSTFNFFDELANGLEDVYDVIFYGLGIAELSWVGILFLVAVIGVMISVVISVIIYVLEAIPIFKLAKKVGCRYAWLAWCPVFGKYCRLFVLTAIPGEKELEIFNGQYKFKNRSLSFWIYVGIAVFGTALITAAVGILSLIPFIGQIIATVSWTLYLIPSIACGILEYIYLRDVLDIFKADKKANSTASIIVTVLDNLATLGFARTVYLYTILKYEPIVEKEYEIG